MDSGVEFGADMPHANKMALQVLAVFAEYERDQISERTRRALPQAKERGVQLGGPKRLEASALGVAANKANADRFAANIIPIIREIQASGVTTLRGVARALNARGVQSARGVPWSPEAVSNIHGVMGNTSSGRLHQEPTGGAHATSVKPTSATAKR
jgi:DNA invertase Pin-like site-specific DNA recombinase